MDYTIISGLNIESEGFAFDSSIPNGNIENVLIVSADFERYRRMKRTLFEINVSCVKCEEFADSVVKLKNFRYQIIIILGRSYDEFVINLCSRFDKLGVGNRIPIIAVTEMDEDIGRASALDAGADDAFSISISSAEMAARFRANRRRLHKTNQIEIKLLGDLTVNCDERIILHGKCKMVFTAMEFKLILHLLYHPNQIFARPDLLRSVWGEDFHHDYRKIDAYIKRVRKIIAQARAPIKIESIREVGYCLKLNYSEHNIA